MNLRNLGKVFRRFTGLDQNQQSLLRRYMREWWGGAGTASGQTVTVEKGLEQDTVLASITRIANAVAMTPWPVYQREQRERRKAAEHPNFRVLNVRTNRQMTPLIWKQLAVTHVLGWGNAFSEIERNNRGDVIALNPMHPADVLVEGYLNGELVYSWVNKENKKFFLPQSKVLHIRGLTFDGVMGVSPLMHQKELIGRTKAREEFQSRFYSNGAAVGGVITTPEELTDEQLERNRKSFEEMFSGSANAHKMLLLEGAKSFTQLTVNPRDAEFASTAKLDRAAIAAIFGVPLSLINESEGNRASTEQLFREFLMLALNFWFSNFEQEVNGQLFSEQDVARGFYSEFMRESLIQADTAVLIEALSKEVLTAIMTPNEARAKLNMNPVEGGDSLLAPVNLMPIETLGRPREVSVRQDGTAVTRLLEAPAALAAASEQDRAEDTPEERSRRGRRRTKAAARALFKDAFQRIGKRERQDVIKQAKKNLRTAQAFNLFLDEYFKEDGGFQKYVATVIGPVAENVRHSIRDEIATELKAKGKKLEASGKDFVRDYVKLLAFRYASSSKGQLAKVVREAAGNDEPFELIEERLQEWEETRAGKEAENEGTRMTNAVSRAFYSLGGVTKLVWKTVGDSCPFCSELDGKVVGINEPFKGKGDQQDDGKGSSMKVHSNTFSPPLHGGCECEIVPG